MNHEVAILFKNGSTVSFEAQEFDIDLSEEAIGTDQYSVIQKFSYKDSRGNETPLYLVPNEVSGIVVAYTNTVHARPLKVGS